MPTERRDWQPHEQLSGGSSPAEDWTEPMVDMSNSSNPPEEHVAKHLLTGGLKPEDVEPDPRAILAERDLLKQRVAELEANVADARSNADILQGGMNKWRDEYCVERKRVAELEAALKLERGAVEILGVELETRSGICACDVQDGWEQHRGGNTVGACWAAWARERRAVDKLAEHIEIACEGFSHGSMSAITVAPGGYMDAADIAAWARNRAREEGGE